MTQALPPSDQVVSSDPLDTALSRRDFLKRSLACLAAACLPFQPDFSLAGLQPLPPPAMTGRITKAGVRVFAEPDEQSRRILRLERDTLLPLLEEIISTTASSANPRWYRVADGYVNSASVQRVDAHHTNPPLRTVPPGGLLAEVTVPWSQSVYRTKAGLDTPLYRLYFGSLYWVTGVDEDAAGNPRCILTDDWLRVSYRVPAADLRALHPSEFSPIDGDIPARHKRLVVSLGRQTLRAYAAEKLVYEARVSTGKKYMETPAGGWRIDRKYPSRHMGDGALTADLRAYELPGVPWVSFFHAAGIAFHGTYWHDNFGTPTSHGCVNLTIPDALWVFRWTSPVYPGTNGDSPLWKISARNGTRVEVTE